MRNIVQLFEPIKYPWNNFKISHKKTENQPTNVSNVHM